jgi:hypothetical protein
LFKKPFSQSLEFIVCSTKIARASGRSATTLASHQLKHDPEKACPALDAGWEPVFGKDHAQTKSQLLAFYTVA